MSEQIAGTEREVMPRARLHQNKQEQLRTAVFGDMCTILELADALGVKQRTIYLYMRLGCPYSKIGARRLFSPARVHEWIRSREIDLTPRGRGRPRKNTRK